MFPHDSDQNVLVKALDAISQEAYHRKMYRPKRDADGYTIVEEIKETPFAVCDHAKEEEDNE